MYKINEKQGTPFPNKIANFIISILLYSLNVNNHTS